MSLSYEITNWENGKTVLKAEHLRKIEKGITDIISENDAIYKDEDIRKSNEKQRQEEHSRKMNEVSEIVSDIQKDYDSLQKIIIDANASANLQNQINQTNSQLEHNTSMLNKIMNNFDNIDLNINYNYNRILKGMDVNYNKGFKGIYEGEYILNNHRFKYSSKTPKTLNSTLSLEHGIKDSFIIKEDDVYYMFFTSFEESDGDIGYATSLDLKNWVYKGIVIRKDQRVGLKDCLYGLLIYHQNKATVIIICL